MQAIFDLAIIGGGINGAGIAADAAGRGHSVYLCESKDFGSATSWASSKLIHGGLRYLEHYEFRLVREALAERENLLLKAPHLIKPLRFILPHRPHLRPAWMIKAGLFLYDHLSDRGRLGKSESYKPTKHPNPLKDTIQRVFEYSDCFVDDSRLVISNIISAAENGAKVENYTQCTGARREADHWVITTEDASSGATQTIRARTLINATGPWAQQFIETQLDAVASRGVHHIKGSHLIVPKLDELGDKAYILQNEDKRIVFVIPYLQDYTLIGTTDKNYSGDLRSVDIDEEETTYLLDVINAHFKTPVTRASIIASYSGVRPLCDDESDDPSAMTRDYTLDVESNDNNELPLLNIYGGKITTYRRLGEAALELLQPFLNSTKPKWNEQSTLPGAEGWSDFCDTAPSRYSWLSDKLLQRYLNQFGSRTERLLQGCRNTSDLGYHFGAQLFEREVDYLIDQEWTKSSDDLLKLRTKLYLQSSAIDDEKLQQHISKRLANHAQANAQLA